MKENALSKLVGKRLSLAILISILVHFVLLILLGLWTVYRYVQEGDPGMEVAMEQGEEMESPQEIVEEVEVTEIQPEVEIDLDRLTVDPIHDVVLPEIVADTTAVPTPPTPSVPTAISDRVSFIQASTRRAGSSFGSTEFYESSLVGTFFDLKQDPEGNRIRMNQNEYVRVLRRLHESGLSDEVFGEFFSVPRDMYLTHLAVEKQQASYATQVFEVEDLVQPRHWLIHYRGYIRPEQLGTYSFVGSGDDAMMVYIDGEIVLEANWSHTRVNAWEPSDNRPTGRRGTNPFSGIDNRFGDWVEFGHQPRRIDILFGENPGGRMGGGLFVKKKGVNYDTQQYNGREMYVLPLFATAALLDEERETIMGFQDHNQNPLEGNFKIEWNKPIFRVVRHVE